MKPIKRIWTYAGLMVPTFFAIACAPQNPLDIVNSRTRELGQTKNFDRATMLSAINEDQMSAEAIRQRLANDWNQLADVPRSVPWGTDVPRQAQTNLSSNASGGPLSSGLTSNVNGSPFYSGLPYFCDPTIVPPNIIAANRGCNPANGLLGPAAPFPNHDQPYPDRRIRNLDAGSHFLWLEYDDDGNVDDGDSFDDGGGCDDGDDGFGFGNGDGLGMDRGFGIGDGCGNDDSCGNGDFGNDDGCGNDDDDEPRVFDRSLNRIGDYDSTRALRHWRALEINRNGLYDGPTFFNGIDDDGNDGEQSQRRQNRSRNVKVKNAKKNRFTSVGDQRKLRSRSNGNDKGTRSSDRFGRGR